MKFLLLPHGKISEKNIDELRLLMSKWDRMNTLTYRAAAVYLIPLGFAAVLGASLFLMNSFTYIVSSFSKFGTELKFITLLPPVLEICLLFFCAMIKGRELMGYVGTLAAYAANALILLSFGWYYAVFVALSVVPALLVVRSLINYPLLKKLKTQPGYPTFIRSTTDRFGPSLPIDKELHPANDDYAPWSAFKEEEKQP